MLYWCSAVSSKASLTKESEVRGERKKERGGRTGLSVVRWRQDRIFAIGIFPREGPNIPARNGLDGSVTCEDP